MKQESRTRKTFLNVRVNLIFYFLTLTLSFFSRKIFLDILGADFVGLTGTLQNLLSYLNIIDLGIGTAVGYLLYKPLFEKNQEIINEIISVFGYLYRWVGIIILTIGVILSLFLPWIFPDTRFEFPIIVLTYYSFLASSLIGYFINYRQTLLSADQRNYVVTAYFQTGNIVKIIIQMISAYFTRSYYLWIVIEFIFGIIYSFILNWKINKVYPWLKSDIRNGKKLLKKYPKIIKLTKQVFVHRIAGIAQYQTTPFLIYAFISLQTVAIYGNYSLLTEKVKRLLKNTLNSTTAGIGNLIAEGNKERILDLYWELMAIRFLFAGIFTISLYYLIPIFIELWLGSQYILPEKTLIMILIIFALDIVRGTTDQFLNAYGLYYDIWAPIAESIIFIIVAIIGGTLWELEGILLGSIISMLIIVYGWKPYFLFSKGFNIAISKYWLGIIKYISISLIAIIIFDSIKRNIIYEVENYTWMNFIYYSLFIGITYSVIHFIIIYIGSKSMRRVIKRFIH